MQPPQALFHVEPPILHAWVQKLLIKVEVQSSCSTRLHVFPPTFQGSLWLKGSCSFPSFGWGWRVLLSPPSLSFLLYIFPFLFFTTFARLKFVQKMVAAEGSSLEYHHLKPIGVSWPAHDILLLPPPSAVYFTIFTFVRSNLCFTLCNLCKYM